MTRQPLHPRDIPDDTTTTGLVGWVGESLTRALVLRLTALSALLGALLAGLSQDAPTWSRVTAIVFGVGGAFALLITQWFAWPRGGQWLLILGFLGVTGALLAFHLTQR